MSGIEIFLILGSLVLVYGAFIGYPFYLDYKKSKQDFTFSVKNTFLVLIDFVVPMVFTWLLTA